MKEGKSRKMVLTTGPAVRPCTFPSTSFTPKSWRGNWMTAILLVTLVQPSVHFTLTAARGRPVTHEDGPSGGLANVVRDAAPTSVYGKLLALDDNVNNHHHPLRPLGAGFPMPDSTTLIAEKKLPSSAHHKQPQPANWGGKTNREENSQTNRQQFVGKWPSESQVKGSYRVSDTKDGRSTKPGESNRQKARAVADDGSSNNNSSESGGGSNVGSRKSLNDIIRARPFNKRQFPFSSDVLHTNRVVKTVYTNSPALAAQKRVTRTIRTKSNNRYHKPQPGSDGVNDLQEIQSEQRRNREESINERVHANARIDYNEISVSGDKSGKSIAETDYGQVLVRVSRSQAQVVRQKRVAATAGADPYPHVSKMVLTALGSLVAILGISVMAAIFQCCCRRKRGRDGKDDDDERSSSASSKKDQKRGEQEGGSHRSSRSKSPSPHKTVQDGDRKIESG